MDITHAAAGLAFGTQLRRVSPSVREREREEQGISWRGALWPL